MFQRIYNISIFSSRIYMKFHAIFAPYLDVDAYISLINICSHFFQSRNKNFLEWEETLFSLHSHLKNIDLNAWADLVGDKWGLCPLPLENSFEGLGHLADPQQTKYPSGPNPWL